jgi:hypothetical protein
VSVKVKTRFDKGKVKRAVSTAKVTGLGHAGALVRKIARNSIRRSAKESPPGSPPHTRKGQIKRAILYAVERDRVVIGPSADVVGESGKAHEFGGRFRKEVFPKRPFMGPALEKTKERLPSLWQGSVRG